MDNYNFTSVYEIHKVSVLFISNDKTHLHVYGVSKLVFFDEPCFVCPIVSPYNLFTTVKCVKLNVKSLISTVKSCGLGSAVGSASVS